MENELRFYCFVNFYLSSIQQGIQTGHAAVDLVTKYLVRGGDEPPSFGPIKLVTPIVEEWASKWKTFIILNGGDSDGIRKISEVIKASGFPWIEFFEAQGSLDGIQTCVGAVLPETIFNAKIAAPGSGFIYEYVKDCQCSKCGRSTPQARQACDRWDCETLEKIGYGPDHAHIPLINVLKSCRLAQ